MTKGILGRKVGMTQIFLDNGELVPVTVVQAEPNVVLQKRTKETDGYEAVQLGFYDKKDQRANKAEKGHAEKANTTPKRYVREFRTSTVDEYEVGQEIGVDVFESGRSEEHTSELQSRGHLV